MTLRRSVRRLALPLTVSLALALAACGSEPNAPWEPVSDTVEPSTTPDPEDSELHGSNHVSPGCSAFIVGFFVDLPFGAMVIMALGVAAFFRRRARAERAFDPAAPLRDGLAVIFGVVEIEPGAEAPVAVRIDQQGSEQRTKNGTNHTWKETARTVLARPFHVRRDDGARVRVEPDLGVVLHGAFVRTERHAVERRTRVAQVGAGDRVHVHGELIGAHRGQSHGAYRGSGAMPVLRAPRLSPMLISSEPPGHEAASQMRFHAWSAAALAAAFALFSLVLAPTYQLLAVDGHVLRARPMQTRTWQEWVKPKNEPGRWVRRWALQAEARTRSGETLTLEDQCSDAAYDCARSGRCSAVPFIVSTMKPSEHQIGSRPKLSGLAPVLIVVLGLVLGVIYPLAALERRPWYIRRRVVDHGSGPLSGSKD